MKRFFLTVLFMTLVCSPIFAQDGKDNQTAGPQKIYAITINGIITNSTASFVESSTFKAAENNGILLIKLNTPGGVLESTRNIVQTLLSSKAPVVVYVTPSGARAASAGIFITMASDWAIMDEGTNIGAAHPVGSDGKDIEGEMGKKVTNDTVAFIRSIAEKRGKNIKDAEKMVIDSASFTATEALKLNIIDAILPAGGNITNLLASKYNLPPNTQIESIDPTFTQKVLGFLANPNILAGLLFLGVMFIGLEFKMPGTFLFAGIGAIFLILFGIGSNIIPINYLAVFLMLAGLALLIGEIFITSFGIMAVGGIVALFFGMRMLFDHGENMGINISLWLIFAILGMAALIVLLIGRLIVKDFKRRPASGMETILNKKAKIIEWENGKGKIAIYGEIWNAISSSELQVGDEVRIESYEDMILRVKKG